MQGAAGPAWAASLEASLLGSVARESAWLYPVVSVLHVLGVALLVGGIVAFDLRVLGFGRALPLEALARLILPLARTGFAAAALSGLVMFAADATHLVSNPMVWLKAGLLAAAGANVALFHRVAVLPRRGEPAALARASAACSVLLWLCVAAAGRAIAYL